MFRTFIWQLLFIFLLLNYSIFQHVHPSTQQWDYQRHGPDTWPHLFDTCEGEFQSPIDIRIPNLIYDPHLHPLSFNGYTTNSSLHQWNFTHNGKTIIAYPPPLANFSISGASLPEIFYLIQFQFHWGYNVYQGSEHTFNGFKYPLEVQFIHRGRFSNALAIVSILFELRQHDNPYIDNLLSILNQTVDTSISIEHQLDISRLFPTDSSPRFYLYNGSLTIPPCTEDVTWIILARKIPISANQLEIFTQNSIPSNFRHTQKLYSRKVLANFQPELHESFYTEEDTSIHHSFAHTKKISKFFLLLILIIFWMIR
ncbi:unnamed protein product [Adineta steineri]|uniref:carbonic anhydrase n=1 Tax=Adineta steineri TaxID=433720 RepID=A0A818MH81_9BILA|nr:unnamed protein product [Adineta steineri]CAF3584865.1 unnamed protein product [Adineta steineri]